jgi:hypothetical protein
MLQAKLSKYKMNPQYPSFKQIQHDALVTTFASCCGAAVEVTALHLGGGSGPEQRAAHFHNRSQ